MSEEKCLKCNTLLWNEQSKYSSQKEIEFKKQNINILKIEFDSDCDSLTLEIILACKTCNEEKTLCLSGYTPYGAFNSSFN